MRRIWNILLLSLALLLAVSACEKAAEAPTATPDRASIQAAGTLFAQPTRSARPTVSATPLNGVELELSRSLAAMERAAWAGDGDGYLLYVSQADPLFWTEHARWVQDWLDHPLRSFEMDVYGIESTSETTATGRLTIRWALREPIGAETAGGATVSALFRYEDGVWKFGGEDWTTAATRGFRLYYFANKAIDNTAQAMALLDALPSIFTGVTHEFGYTPTQVAPLKLYESRVTLFNFTRLSQPQIQVWNEPGEAIKLALSANHAAPDDYAVAREYTRFVLSELGAGARGAFTWWLEEGLAEYGGQHFRPLSRRNQTLKRIAALASALETADDHLLRWEDLQTRPDLPDPLMTNVVEQSYSLVHYVTETRGVEARNAWIRAVAGGQDFADAAQATLGAPWDEIEAGWRAWLLGLE